MKISPILICTLAACSHDSTTEIIVVADAGTTVGVDAAMNVDATLVTPRYSGVYEADALLDFTQPGVLPGLASPALAALSNLGSDPGTAIVGFAVAAGAIDLDATLQSIIGAIITQQLDSVLSQQTRDDLQLISDITSITKTSTINTSVTVHTPSLANGSGEAQLNIQVTGATFDFVDLHGNPQHVAVATPLVDYGNAGTTITAQLKPHADAPIADADLAWSGATLDLPIGDYVLSALGPLVFQPEWGTSDIDSTLQYLMQGPCMELGALVETGVKDVTTLDIGAGVGTTICEAAVTIAAQELTSQLESLAVHGAMIDGRATLSDVSPTNPTVDYQSDLLTGTWTWTLGSATVPASIDNGNRTADAL